MTEMQAKKGGRPIFRVAKELNQTSTTIMDFLSAKGVNLVRGTNTPISEEHYVELLQKYDRPRYQKYLAESAVSPENDPKEQAKLLREEQKSTLLQSKKGKSPEPGVKIELPKITPATIIEPAPKASSAASDTESPKGEAIETVASDAQEFSQSSEPAATVTPDFAESVVSRDIQTAAVAEPAESITESISVEQPQEATEPVTSIRPKIELPQWQRMKIIEEARKEPPKPRGPDKPKEQVKAKETPKPKETAKSSGTKLLPLPLVKIEGEAKKKLKRKKPVVPIETTSEDVIETKVERELIREREKSAKVKPPPQTELIREKSPKRKRHRKSKIEPPVKVEETGAISTKGRKKKQLSEAEVVQTIRQTMARTEGRTKHKRRAGPAAAPTEANAAPIKVTEFITTQELAGMMNIPVQDVIKRCIEMGMIVSINQRLERDVIELLAAEFNYNVQFVQDEELEEEEAPVATEHLVKRPPVVTIMGHVDHGKTTLLDFLRKSRVAEKEAGSITQHIGAYEINYNGERIAFLDTPGHEAFTAMRARGAQITDIVVLVVAADDRVMPQTLEAIDHARAAGTPIVVAVNKIDKPTANPEAIYKQLADRNVLVEKWGGKYQSAEISAKFGQGIDNLLAEILVAAEILDLKADPGQRARGVVVESRLDKGLGAVSTVLVQNGTLRIGDNFVVGWNYGRVRALYNDRNEPITEAGPATPVQVVGVNGVPQAGDKFVVFPSEKEAREVSQRRQRQQREMSMRQIHALTLDQMNRRIRERTLQELPLIIKGDVHGSVEVLSDALMKLSTDEVKVNIIHRGVGGIVESDVLLAAASQAVIIGFHVHPNIQAKELARREGVEIRLYRIIHEVVDHIRQSLEGMLAPIQEEHALGTLEVRQVFKISRIGTVAGCYVLDGKITRNSRVRLIRDNVEIYSGTLGTLKRFKDDVREVSSGFECGLTLEHFRDIREGDIIQVYEIVETARKLEAVV